MHPQYTLTETIYRCSRIGGDSLTRVALSGKSVTVTVNEGALRNERLVN